MLPSGTCRILWMEDIWFMTDVYIYYIHMTNDILDIYIYMYNIIYHIYIYIGYIYIIEGYLDKMKDDLVDLYDICGYFVLWMGYSWEVNQ